MHFIFKTNKNVKNFTKLQVLLVIICLLCSTVSFSQTFTIDKITYQVTSTNPNTVEITKETTATGDVTIPETVSNNSIEYSVTSIGFSAFSNNLLTSVEIPNSITSIGTHAFSNNELVFITIPKGITPISDYAFYDNHLAGFTISNNVDTVESDAFRNNNLASITMGSNVTLIAGEAFTNNKLTNIVIPKNVSNIRESFKDNPLTLIISESIKPASFFSKSFGDRTNINLIIPEGTEADYTAAGWTGFKSVTEEAIDLLFTIENITYKIISTTLNTVEIIGATTVASDLAIPATVTNNDIDYSVVAIGGSAFKSHNLTNVTIPNSVTTIGEGAFANNELTSITFSSGITSIEDYVFYGNKLTNITIPNSITSIGESAFKNNELTDVTIPDSLTVLLILVLVLFNIIN